MFAAGGKRLLNKRNKCCILYSLAKTYSFAFYRLIKQNMHTYFGGLVGCALYQINGCNTPEMIGLESVLSIDLFPRTEQNYNNMMDMFPRTETPIKNIVDLFPRTDKMKNTVRTSK